MNQKFPHQTQTLQGSTVVEVSGAQSPKTQNGEFPKKGVWVLGNYKSTAVSYTILEGNSGPSLKIPYIVS